MRQPNASSLQAAGSLWACAGGQQLLIATHSSTGKGGQRTRLFEDMLEIELVSGMKVQVRPTPSCLAALCHVA